MNFSQDIYSGVVFSRVTADEVTPEVMVRLRPRPGDAVTAGISAVAQPDGEVTEEDAKYGLALCLGKPGYSYQESLDVKDVNNPNLYSQDGQVTLEDVQAIWRADMDSSTEFPASFQDLRQPATITFKATENSRVYIYDMSADYSSTEVKVPIASSPIKNIELKLEISSFPVRFAISLAEMDESPVGTIVHSSEAKGLPIYSIQMNGLEIDCQTIPWSDSFGVSYWNFHGSLKGGEGINDKITIHTGADEGYESYFYFLLELEQDLELTK